MLRLFLERDGRKFFDATTVVSLKGHMHNMFSCFRTCMLCSGKSPSPTKEKRSELNIDQEQLEEGLTPILRKNSEAHRMKKKWRKVRFALQDDSQDDEVITDEAQSSKISPDNLVKTFRGTTLYPSTYKSRGLSKSWLKQPKLGEHQKHTRPERILDQGESHFVLYGIELSCKGFNIQRRSSAWRKYSLRAGNSYHIVPNEFLIRENPVFVSMQESALQQDLSSNGDLVRGKHSHSQLERVATFP